MTLAELADRIGATLEGDGTRPVASCATLEDAQADQLSFLANPRYLKLLDSTRAAAVVIAPSVRPANPRLNLLRAKDPYHAFTQAMVALHGFRTHPHAGIHPLASVDPTATIGPGTILYPFVYVGPRAVIGRDCILYPNVTVYDDSILGDRVTLHAGCSIGHDGFGYATARADGEPDVRHHKIPQAGRVVIEDDVELGANCSVDRATLGATVIGRGTKFSNNVVIGHGSRLGRHDLLVAQVGIAGSVTLGDYVVVGGQVGIAGHLTVGDRVQIAAQSGVMDDLEPGQQYLGSPAMPIGHARRVYAHVASLPTLARRIKELEARLAQLEEKPA